MGQAGRRLDLGYLDDLARLSSGSITSLPNPSTLCKRYILCMDMYDVGVCIPVETIDLTREHVSSNNGYM